MNTNKLCACMIVYIKDENRVINYHAQKLRLSCADLQLVEAVDTNNFFDKHKKIAIDNQLLDEYYVTHYLQNKNKHKQWGSKGKGALGCDMSHIECYKNILSSNEFTYCLILEDDAIITKNFCNNISQILEQAIQLQSDYVHLSCNEKFRNKQYNKNNKLSNLLYKMIPQWHTTAQLVSTRGAEKLLSILPHDAPIDITISRHIDMLNATSSIIHVDNGGAASGGDKKSRFGSLIW